ncbi:ELMO domain-containing protein 3 [Nilaparvata lugens]|uniref:ELMO domain-containing protein 3 n=1 Tax=Nilaparvata lugens TaxID=108931 RepID=UPI000B986A60|nr:ELMO domain-containing protein 3 [Nilaparvata lugens]
MDLDLGSRSPIFVRSLENIAEEEKLSDHDSSVNSPVGVDQLTVDQKSRSSSSINDDRLRVPCVPGVPSNVGSTGEPSRRLNLPLPSITVREPVKKQRVEIAVGDGETSRLQLPLISIRNALEAASEEWSKVPTVGGDTAKIQTPLISPEIDVEEAFNYFRGLNLPHDSNSNSVASARVRWKGFVQWLHTPPKLSAHLKPDCDLIYSIVQCSLDWEDNVHWRMLQTIYKQLTGSKIDCPQFGSHWQLIGFQGSDPATDLRGVGLLGLLQFLFLSTKQECAPLARKLYTVANSDNQAFPLAVLSLNVTQIALNALRSGKLNKECNNRQTVLLVVNLFYIAVLHYIITIWVAEQKTIKDSGYLLKDAEKYCCKNVRKLIQDIPEQLEKYSK